MDREINETDAFLQEDIYNQREIDMIKLSEDVKELSELFTDVNLMVKEQDLLLDTIEMNVMRADDMIQSGTSQLSKADTLQKKASNKLKYIAGSLIAIGGVIGVGLGLRFTRLK